jgi:membrane protease YdiL (CAAX protease family)
VNQLPAPPLPWRDHHLQLTLAGTALTGLGLWLFLPPGSAHHLTASPWSLMGFLLVYPVIEEWLFRGLLQKELLRLREFQRRHLGITGANGATTLAFTLLHLVHQPFPWALTVALPSLALGHFRERYGNLRLPIALHILFNAIYLAAGLSA